MFRREHAFRNLAWSTLSLVGVLLTFVAGEGRARGAVLYQTGFEPPTFTAGSSVDGQGGFSVTTGNAGAITISAAQPNAGAQDLLFTGRTLSDSPPPIGPGFYIGTTGVTTSYDAVASGKPLVTFEAFVRLDGPSTATGVGHTGDLVSINLEAILGDGSYFSTYLSSDGNAYGFSTGYDAMTPAALDTYHDLKLILDFSNRTSTYVIDGLTFGTKAFDSSVTSSVLSDAQFSMYAIDPTADRTAYTARADDFSVQAVPEPSSLVTCLIGIFAATAVVVRGHRFMPGCRRGSHEKQPRHSNPR